MYNYCSLTIFKNIKFMLDLIHWPLVFETILVPGKFRSFDNKDPSLQFLFPGSEICLGDILCYRRIHFYEKCFRSIGMTDFSQKSFNSNRHSIFLQNPSIATAKRTTSCHARTNIRSCSFASQFNKSQLTDSKNLCLVPVFLKKFFQFYCQFIPVLFMFHIYKIYNNDPAYSPDLQLTGNLNAG